MPGMAVLATLLGFGVMVAYVFAAGPTFYWLDSSELVAASWGLGVSIHRGTRSTPWWGGCSACSRWGASTSG